MSIPLNNIVKINPGVLDVGNNGNNLFGLMLVKQDVDTDDDTKKRLEIQRALRSNQTTTITNADQIGKIFGYDSTEYDLATVYFAGFTNSDRVASTLYLAPYYTKDSSAKLIGASLEAIRLEDLRTFSGDIQIEIDSVIKTATNIDFSNVNSFSDAADILEKKLGVIVVYSSGYHAFIISSLTTGQGSSVGFATGSLADRLRLTGQSGAMQSEAVSNPTIQGQMDILCNDNLTFCSVFLSWEATSDENMSFAKWVNSMQDDCCVILSDSSNAAIIAQTGTSFAEQVHAAGYEGVVCVYNNLELCAFIAGYPAAWDLTKTDGRFTAAFRRSNLLTPNVIREDQALALKANGYNFYGSWASATSNFTFMYEGRISGQYIWLDSWFCQVWMRRQLQYQFVLTLLARGQVPYNTDGKGILTTAIKPAINQFMNFGAIRTGISLSDDQVQSLKQAGLNQSQINNITTVGYYLKVDMERVTPQTRVARGSPPINFWYTDGQSVQSIIMNSIEIQ
ncbi:unnamed protein product [Commensalibacter communis]|uniref:Tail sheath protein n=1 Tax=Commensalibacter communis TaxID=2972786 RepID=A0A9W4TRZ5_9PROT|nr:DUF3383 family protein [Commensalibacter communis]CAI3941748.1 unnamed protein product [Commensalibacter communis]CAI3944883.1 unnamed protein product [Commensalibacter communis]CAI3959087.1 unnamed protein product [Commensalibacter communis]CAI3960974.1 unnamed protein product [Commensalibacter communis]